MSGLNRRAFLKGSALGLAAMSATARLTQAAESPFGPFKMGMQTYSVRNWKVFDEVLQKATELGLTHLEFWNGHMPQTTDAAKIDEMKKKLAAVNIKPAAYGVVNMGADPKANRAVFEFAAAMGIETVSVDFDPKSIISLDRLCEEFPNIKLGIHNHGPRSRYQTPDDVLNCVKDHHKNIGATADLGHYIRSLVDPLEVIEKLKDRLYGIHFKDFKINDQGKETGEAIPGDGKLKVKETLALLKKVNFQGCLSLEYESNPKDPLPDMKVALERIKAAIKEL
ncbi:MAG TPA: TIM barrel protein [Planctomycetota bacterium]|nr:TIM barrel protein [Planctomycetota bacterium]